MQKRLIPKLKHRPLKNKYVKKYSHIHNNIVKKGMQILDLLKKENKVRKKYLSPLKI